MNHSNLLISIIIVLCIAAGVTAYGLTNPDNVFSNLAGFTPTTDSVTTLGDNIGDGIQTSDSSNAQGDSNSNNGQSDAGSGNSNNGDKQTTSQNGKTPASNGNGNSNSHSTNGNGNSNSGNGNGNSRGNSGGNNNGGSSNGGSNVNKNNTLVSNITETKAIDIANNYTLEEGTHATKAVWENNTWYVSIYDSNGEHVDNILLDWKGDIIGRG